MEESQNNDFKLTAISMVASMLMIAQHIAAKAARDALFLTYFDVSQLPTLMMVSAAASVAAVLLMARMLTKHGPAKLIPPLFLISAALLAVQWSLSSTAPKIAAVALYLHASALNTILISGFWSVVNERFDPYAAKQIIPKLTAAASFGGIVGGLAASAVASAADTRAILLMLSGMHLTCAAAVATLARGSKSAPRSDAPTTDLFAPLKRSSLIRRMALLTLFVSTTAGVLDYILKAQASASLSSAELITFFSFFYTAVGLATFLLQSALGNSALRWFGLGGTMAAWPIAVLVTGGGALMLRSLAAVTLMRGSANLFYNSFFRSGFELLYTPIAPADKRAGKVLIDVGAERSGDLLSGLVVMLILMIPVASESVLMVTALILATSCLGLLLALHRGYVSQLADNLRSGALRAEDLDVVDATTARTIAVTQTSIERDELLRGIEAYRDSQSNTPRPSPAETQPTTPSPDVTTEADLTSPPAPVSQRDLVTEAIAELRSGDEERIRRVLAGRPLTSHLLPHVIPLLADERVLQAALGAMHGVATTAPGQLVDALLDPRQHPLVKRRLPLILGQADSPVAVHGLTAGVGDADWNVRYRCARGLHNLRRRHPTLKASESSLLAAVHREIRSLHEEGTTDTAKKSRIDLLFQLFGALYDPETLELCQHALDGDDRSLQGTALEYLENLLPSHIWGELHPLLALPDAHVGKKRSLQQAARALFASAPSLRARRAAAKSDATATDAFE